MSKATKLKEHTTPKTKIAKGQYRKDKPWDTPDIDKWKIEPFLKTDNKHSVLEESSFEILFPKYREDYLSNSWKKVEEMFKPLGIEAVLNLREGKMIVKTTAKMYDPFMIFKARDFCRLLARCVGLQEASKIVKDDNLTSDVVKIGTFTRSKTKFMTRRKRLVGPNGSTLKALEILTDCYFFVQGTTVSIIGPWKKMKIARRVVEDCMSNKIHPVYTIKELMVKRELENNEDLKSEIWTNYLPKFAKSKGPKKRQKVETGLTFKKTFTDTNTPRKIDEDMDAGTYFIQKKLDGNRRSKKSEKSEKSEKSGKSEKSKPVKTTREERNKKRLADFIPPTKRAKTDK